MLLIYDHDNVLHITNDKGLRWNYDKADKPQFSFDYDSLFFIEHDDLFEIELGDDTLILDEEQKVELKEYVSLCEPPLELTLSKQYMEDLIEEKMERIGWVVNEINDYSNFADRADLMIAGREGSQDPRRQIARRVMEWMDFTHGVVERICEELRMTIDSDLKDFDFYQESMPSAPKLEHFLDERQVDERFNTDTLDVHGGEKELGEDKKAV